MLRKTVKEVGFHSIIYVVGGVASMFASVLLLPVYTRFLSKADYGIIEIIDSVRNVFSIILIQALIPAMAKFYKDAASEDDQKAVIGTSFWFVSGFAFLIAMSLFFCNDLAAQRLLGSVEFVIFIDLGITLLFLQAILTTGENYLNIRKKSLFFVIASLCRLCINVAANLYFIVGLDWGPKGMLYGELLSSLALGIVFIVYIIRQNGLHLRLNLVPSMLKFGLPFIPNALSGSLMHRADRFFLSLSDAGLYGLGYRFPFMLNSILLSSFWRIWNTSVMYDVAKQDDYQRVYAKMTTYVVTIYVVCQYMLIVMASTVVKILAAPEYFQSWVVIQVVGLGLCFYCLHNFFVIGAYIKNKTWYLPISHMLAAVINIMLNWYFTPRYGYMAAAWNTVITYFAFSFFNFLLFRKEYPIPYEFRRLGFLFGTGIILVLLNNFSTVDDSFLEFVKQFVFASILPLILLLGPYLEQNEKESLCEELHKIHPNLALVYTRLTLRQKG